MSCPDCDKSLKVRDELVGKTARCPHCRSSITVKRPVASPSPTKTGQKTKGSGAEQSAESVARAQVLSVTANTNVNVGLYALFGLAATVVFYLVLLPFAGPKDDRSYLGRLFMGGEGSTMATGQWVPYTEVFLFFWAATMLVGKLRKIRRQQRALLFDVLPSDIGEKITENNLDKFLEYISELPKNAVGSFLVTRCVRGLEHFRVRKSAADTATMLSSQSDLDAGSVDSSYTMFHVFIWAIPILGFLGTVIGVSSAVGGFTDTLSSSSDMESLKVGLKSITGGLGTSFDTTLVALAMAMILTFPVSALQKREGDVIGEVDEYTNEYLLRRLEDGRNAEDHRMPAANRNDMQDVVQAALKVHRAELEGWIGQLKTLGKGVAADLFDSWKKIDDKQTERITQTEQSLTNFVGRLDGMGEKLAAKVEEGWSNAHDRLYEKNAGQVEQLGKMVESTRDEIAAMASTAQDAKGRSADLMSEAASSVQEYTQSLQKSLSELAETMERLNGQTINVEMKQRSWFGFSGEKKKKPEENSKIKYRN
jgi:methyl-accepting chemotaxis protein/DNA-directed RNA polymerase subunit RPC12/RpoP